MISPEYSKYEIFDQLIYRGIRFALYKLPRSKSIFLVLQTSDQTKKYRDIQSLNSKKGFVISPFSNSDSYSTILIEPDIRLEGEAQVFSYLDHLDLSKINTSRTEFKPKDKGLSSYAEYESVFAKFHKNIEDQTLLKLVLSRTLDIEKKDTWSAGVTLKKALEKYPVNFIYLCHTPESGTWFGCSPEILIAGNNQGWKTDALAGTQKTSREDKAISWDEKNSQEQAIVSRYMQGQLLKVGIKSVHDEPRTIHSGDLVHLKSEFKFDLENRDRVGDVLKALHPSPAVCGYPKDKAFDFIIGNEGYDRAYYSGFIGPLEMAYETDLYVNLRCMQIFEDSLRLYAGGGIMPESNAKSEWRETEYKLQTILSIL